MNMKLLPHKQILLYMLRKQGSSPKTYLKIHTKVSQNASKFVYMKI